MRQAPSALMIDARIIVVRNPSREGRKVTGIARITWTPVTRMEDRTSIDGETL